MLLFCITPWNKIVNDSLMISFFVIDKIDLSMLRFIFESGNILNLLEILLCLIIEYIR